MAKQQVLNLPNGATFVYQKQSAFNGYSFAIGFRGGSQLDGKYMGLSHLLEHLLFRTPNPKSTSTLLDNIVKYNINQNAFTTENDICVQFSSVLDNVDFALSTIVRQLTRRKFTQEQIDQEIAIVKREIAMTKEDERISPYTALEKYLDTIMINPPMSSLDILGDARSLKQVTPELLSEYVKRYFNLNNLVVSVTTNQPQETALSLCEKHIFSKLNSAESEKYIVSPPPKAEFDSNNFLLAIPNEKMYDATIDLIVRVRNELLQDINQEYAYDIIEEYIVNDMGGLLWQRLREKNQLVYLSGLSSLDYGNEKFKIFSATTKPSKIRKTISELCALISGLANDGVTKQKFEDVKKAFMDLNTAKLNKFSSVSAVDNYEQVISSTLDFVDYKKVRSLIAKMTYEDFCEHLANIYFAPNVSLAVEGNIDTRKCYTLFEVEKMVGNYTHALSADNLRPKIEATSSSDLSSAILLNQLGVQKRETKPRSTDETQEGASEQTTSKPTPVEPVRIDDEPIK